LAARSHRLLCLAGVWGPEGVVKTGMLVDCVRRHEAVLDPQHQREWVNMELLCDLLLREQSASTQPLIARFQLVVIPPDRPYALFGTLPLVHRAIRFSTELTRPSAYTLANAGCVAFEWLWTC